MKRSSERPLESVGNSEEGGKATDPPNERVAKIHDIRERAFAFAVRIVKLCQYLEKNSCASRSMINQLLSAGTSVGANLEEARAGQSRADFVHKNAIALKEARESNYWLRLILATSQFEPAARVGVEELTVESMEIANVIGAIIVTTKARK